MRIDVDTIKIVMSLEEAHQFQEELRILFESLSTALTSLHGDTSVPELISEAPTVSSFLRLLKVGVENDDLPF